MTVQANKGVGWENLSARQVLKHTSASSFLHQVADRYVAQPLGQVCESLRGRAQVASDPEVVGAAVLSIPVAALALLGYSSFASTLGNLGLVGAAVLAGPFLGGLLHDLRLRNQANTIEEEARKTADTLVRPDQPGTFLDERHFESGVFQEMWEIRDVASGQVVGAHAKLSTPVPVEIDEDRSTKQLTIHTDKETYTLPGSLNLPGASNPKLVLRSDSSGQSIDFNGSSTFETNADYPYDGRTFPLTQSWSNGYAHPTTDDRTEPYGLFANPIVSAQAMDPGAPAIQGNHWLSPADGLTHRRTEYAFDFPVIPRAQTGHATRTAVASFLDLPNGYRLRQNAGSEELQLMKGEQVTNIPGSWKDRSILFDIEGVTARQSLHGAYVSVSASFPEGRLELKHGSEGEPTAHRFLGETDIGGVPTELLSNGAYRVTLGTKIYEFTPPLSHTVLVG